MTMHMRDFLQRFSMEWPSQFQGRHVRDLVTFMKNQGITRLVAEERDWFLASDGEFKNPYGRRDRRGNIFDLDRRGHRLGCVFDDQNTYFDSLRPNHGTPLVEGDTPIEQGDSGGSPSPAPVGQVRFGLERDLQGALSDSIEQLEPGLKFIDSEVVVAAGRIDILAEDSKNRLVVIELKADIAQRGSIDQLLSYMDSLDEDQDRPVRGILVARDFHPNLVRAARRIPDISLKAYSFQFSFEDR